MLGLWYIGSGRQGGALPELPLANPRSESMTLRTDLLPVVDTLRALTGPSVLDIRTAQLTIRTRVWSGGYIGEGTAADSDLVLPKQYKVENLTSKEVASSGGRFEDGAMRIGPITPDYVTGGYAPSDLKPTVTNDATEVIYILAGQVAGEYSLAQLRTDKPFSYFITVNRKRTTP